jgi:hypothetical protein
MAADRVDFVDEDDAGRVLLALLEHVADAEAPTPTNISTKSEPEMVKNGTLASPAMARRAGSCRCPGGRPAAALRNLAAEPLEFLRVLQELDDLLELALGFLDAGDVVEGDAPGALVQQARLGLAEAHGLAALACIWRITKIQAPAMISSGAQLIRMVSSGFIGIILCSALMVTFLGGQHARPASGPRRISPETGAVVVWPSMAWPWFCEVMMVTSETWPWFTWARNSRRGF